ncbi:MAG: cytochrome c3 family protein [Deltaproteobacteria bacterium]|nr:cytochrome c3 family protein [Deltaproteobacteria bacterium]
MNCHKGQNSSQYGGFITNYDYSQRRGGESKTCPVDIKTSFRFINYSTRLPQINCDLTEPIGSAHDLVNIRNDALQGYWSWGNDRSVINPCLGCHNVHRATRDFPCSLPSGHENKKTWEIWGDESGEKMADYVGGRIYQPPFKAGGSSYERDAYTQPDYNTMCLECHGRDGGLASAQHENVIKIEWGLTVSHGRKAAGALDNGPIRAPFQSSQVGYYVLCCTDCHEPHGSRNEWLLRTEVNGVTGIEVNGSMKWFQLCNACHQVDTVHHLGEGDICGGVSCHGHGVGCYF